MLDNLKNQQQSTEVVDANTLHSPEYSDISSDDILASAAAGIGYSNEVGK